MKVTVVIDNYVPMSTPSPFLGEHGFSLLMETPEAKVLMDCGQSEAVVKNLSLLGVHPDQLDAIVLSHGHYDHAGGLKFVLQHRSKPIPVYAHPDIFKDRYSIAGGRKRQIGVPCVKELLTTLGAQWHLSAEPLEIIPNLFFSGEVPRTTSYEAGDKKLVIEKDDCCECQDPLKDDISLYHKTDKGLVVIGGCTHSGIINTINYCLKLAGCDHVRGWIGGTHLGPVSAGQRSESIKALENYQLEFLATGHCTGFNMMAELQRHFGEKFIHCYVSQVIDID